jgi:hypothetical protein
LHLITNNSKLFQGSIFVPLKQSITEFMEKYTTLKALLTCICIAFVASGCRRVAEPESYDIWLPEVFKEIFLVQPGSYWVMHDIGTGQEYRDSVFVIETNHDTVDIIHPGTREPMALKERFEIKMFSPFYGRTYRIASESLDLCGDLNFNEPCHFIVFESYLGEESEGKSRIYFYPDNEGDEWGVAQSGLSEPGIRIDSVLAVYTLGENVFHNVRKVTIEHDRSMQNRSSIRYISPEAGIIQWIIPGQGINWIAVRYKMER